MSVLSLSRRITFRHMDKRTQKNSEKGEFTSLPNIQLVQNQYVQKCDNVWSTIEIGVSRRDVRWKTVNIKPEVPNITQSWKNQVGFMMQPYQFFKDIGCVVQVPMLETLLKKYKDSRDTSSFGKVMEGGKFKTSDTEQSIQS